MSVVPSVTQLSPVMHFVPHPPQLLLSVVGLLQPEAQQLSPVAHALPQPPQSATLLVVLTHVPPQFVGVAAAQQIGGEPPPLTWPTAQQMPPALI